MSVTLMIVSVYLIPNRFSTSALAACILAVMGLFYMFVSAPFLARSEKAAYIVDFCLLVFLSASAWRTTYRARRKEYARAQELEWLSRTDLLTGLGNRRDFDDHLASALARRRRYGENAALVLLDLDRFKTVNDTFGHQVGDSVLMEIARRLESSLRTEDSLARWGGEEFVLLLPRATDESAREFAFRIKAKISSGPCDRVGIVTASFGITMLRESDAADDVLARADTALYRAKQSGRDTAEFED